MSWELVEEVNQFRIALTYGRYSPNIELRSDLWEQLRQYMYPMVFFNPKSKYNHFLCWGIEIRPYEGEERMRIAVG